MNPTTLYFAAHLFTAVLFGSLVGLERQWHQRMAGTRTNALVAAGAAAFVMAGLQLSGESSAPGRVASYVVSGVGFLGAGVIFKDGANVRGLNTAATIWCSAATGVLCGLGYTTLALILMVAVLLTNTALRPLAYRLHPVLPDVVKPETQYAITLTCRSVDETHLRPLLLAAVSQAHAILQALHSEDESAKSLTRLRADITMAGQRNEEVEQIAMRLSLEPGVTSLSWSIVPAEME
jgi:putative Mg2+ transporter-C (MgtC) family protein